MLPTGPNPAERLRVYHLSLELAVEVGRVVRRLRRTRSQENQLVRSADSIPFNIAEGAYHKSPGLKAQYYRIARASAGESSAILSRLAADNPRTDLSPLLGKLDMISRMLLSLIRSQQALQKRNTPDPPAPTRS
jgi:four helix bundle protein